MLKLDIQQPSCDQFQNRVSADHMAQVYSVQLIEVTCFFIVFCLPANFTSEIHFYKFPLGFWP